MPFLIDFRSPPDLTGGGTVTVLPGNNAGNALNGYIDHVVNQVFSPRPTTIFPQLIEEIISHNEVVNTRETEKSWKTITFLNLPRIASRWPSIKSAGKLKLVALDARRELAHIPRVVAGARHVRRDQEIRPLNDTPPSSCFPIPTRPRSASTRRRTNDAPRPTMPTVEVTFTIDLKTLRGHRHAANL